MQTWIRWAFVVGLAAVLAGATARVGAAAAGPARIRYVDSLIPSMQPDRVVAYRRVGERELKLHVFLPPGWKPADRRPAFVTFHGGGWTGGDARRMYPVAAHSARQGLVAFSVEYRLARPGAGTTVFDCVADGRSAVRAVRARAAEFGVDPARIIANGASAGGHVAVAAVLFGQFDTPGEAADVSAEPNALVLFYPVIDTSEEGYGQAKIGVRWRELSPAHQVRPGLPPTLTFHGTADTTTPLKGAQRFHEAMRQAGNHSELVVHEGGIHGYFLHEQSLFEATLERMEDFLRRVGMWEAR